MKSKKVLIKHAVINLIRLSLAVAILLSLYELRFMALFVSSLTLVLTFIPLFVKKKYNLVLPLSIQLFIVVFLYAAIFLGEVYDYFYRYWWWDSVLHLSSGIALGFAGFLILYILYRTGKFKANPLWIVVFSFCFALALGSLWEIYEFGADEIFGMDMQKARNLCEPGSECDSRLGVKDTMYDLIMNTIGALFASISCYIYLKRKKIFFFGKLIEDFEDKNKRLFEKRKK